VRALDVVGNLTCRRSRWSTMPGVRGGDAVDEDERAALTSGEGEEPDGGDGVCSKHDRMLY
jgi:hypothetical protein